MGWPTKCTIEEFRVNGHHFLKVGSDYDDYLNILPEHIARFIKKDGSMCVDGGEVEVCSFTEVDGKIIAKYELYGVKYDSGLIIEGEYTVEGTLQMIEGEAVFVADKIFG
jgi:hypothetical protein